MDQDRKLRLESPEKWAKRVRQKALRRFFNLSLEEYDVMLEKQGGLCAICNCPERVKHKGTIRRLGVGHNHKTGAIRELLCSNCNRGLGHFQEDTERLVAAAVYLEKHRDTEPVREKLVEWTNRKRTKKVVRDLRILKPTGSAP